MFTYSDVKVYYKKHDGDGVPIILLHGWGGSHISFLGVYNYLAALNKNVIVIDFPSFGESETPPADWGIYEFSNCVQKLLEELSIEKVVVVGHSFGGRVGILLAAKTTLVEKLVLVDSAGLKPRRSLKYYLKVLKYKIAKRRNKNLSSFGSDDYKALSDGQKEIFVRVVNQHLDKYVPAISCPTLIVWGKLDKDTPIYMAKKLNKKIKDSGLVVLENSGHYSYVEQFGDFCKILKVFIK